MSVNAKGAVRMQEENFSRYISSNPSQRVVGGEGEGKDASLKPTKSSAGVRTRQMARRQILENKNVWNDTENSAIGKVTEPTTNGNDENRSNASGLATPKAAVWRSTANSLDDRQSLEIAFLGSISRSGGGGKDDTEETESIDDEVYVDDDDTNEKNTSYDADVEELVERHDSNDSNSSGGSKRRRVIASRQLLKDTRSTSSASLSSQSYTSLSSCSSHKPTCRHPLDIEIRGSSCKKRRASLVMSRRSIIQNLDETKFASFKQELKIKSGGKEKKRYPNLGSVATPSLPKNGDEDSDDSLSQFTPSGLILSRPSPTNPNCSHLFGLAAPNDRERNVLNESVEEEDALQSVMYSSLTTTTTLAHASGTKRSVSAQIKSGRKSVSSKGNVVSKVLTTHKNGKTKLKSTPVICLDDSEEDNVKQPDLTLSSTLVDGRNEKPPSSIQKLEILQSSSVAVEARKSGKLYFSAEKPERKLINVNDSSSDSETQGLPNPTLRAIHPKMELKEVSSDESIPAENARKLRQRLSNSKAGLNFSSEEELDSDADLERIENLHNIENDTDRALQMILWDLKFKFTLHPYQFVGTRKVAGVPDTFPLHPGSGMTVDDVDLRKAAWGLDRYKPDKGMLLCDDMGLGKTIQSVAGAILRNGIARELGKLPLPTIIVSPNKAVQQQWKKALTDNGVKERYIKEGKVRNLEMKGMDSSRFILLDRYFLQSLMKSVFRKATSGTGTSNKLFPKVTTRSIVPFHNQYNASRGKAKDNKYKHQREYIDDCVTRKLRELGERLKKLTPAHRLFIIDEAHFLRNRVALWSLCAGLTGLRSERTICLTGTPFNNRPNDVASLVTLFDPRLPAAKSDWWENAITRRNCKEVAQRVETFYRSFFLRRTKEETLSKMLGAKTIRCNAVKAHVGELHYYLDVENKLMKLMNVFTSLVERGDDSRIAILKRKNLMQQLVAMFQVCRMTLIHPVLHHGREITIQFSPSRRHLAAKCEKKSCVFCEQSMRPSILIKTETIGDGHDSGSDHKKRLANKSMDMSDFVVDDNYYGECASESDVTCIGDDIGSYAEEEEEQQRQPTQRRTRDVDVLNDDYFEADFEEDDDFIELNETTEDDIAKGPLVEVPSGYCMSTAVTHYAHEVCLEKLHHNAHCPRCEDLHKRLFNKFEGNKQGHPHHCKHIKVFPNEPGSSDDCGGFVGTAKLEAFLSWFNTVPETDKVLILSYFKSSLDLVEGLLMEEMGVQCRRFDGDVDAEERQRDLDCFKKNKNCRALLATVASGGVGLNIVEANHVCFLDRWFNPTVHDQAMDRCYRIGQEKDVDVVFLDCVGTIDETMKIMNDVKTKNSRIVLAGGKDLGQAGGNVNMAEMAGLLRRTFQAVIAGREEATLEGVLGPTDPDRLATAIEGGSVRSTKKSGKKKRKSNNEN